MNSKNVGQQVLMTVFFISFLFLVGEYYIHLNYNIDVARKIMPADSLYNLNQIAFNREQEEIIMGHVSLIKEQPQLKDSIDELYKPEASSPNKRAYKLLKASYKGGWAFRIIFFFVSIIFFLFLDIQDRHGRRKLPEKFGNVPIGISIAGLLCLFLLFITVHRLDHIFLLIAFPVYASGIMACSFIIGSRYRIYFDNNYGIKNEKNLINTPVSVNWNINNNGIEGYLNLRSTIQGCLIAGGAGAGKTYSILMPMIRQLLEKGQSGIIYDYKFNDPDNNLTNQVFSVFKSCHITDRKLWIVNFSDVTRSHRVNPLNPDTIEDQNDAWQAAIAFLYNLKKEWIKNKDFWADSAIAAFAATIWYVKKNYPQYCTLPHVVTLIMDSEPKWLIQTLCSDGECLGMIKSIHEAYVEKASDQIAGVIASLKLPIARIYNKECFWVLTGDDFKLDLNDKKDPGVLCVGNHSEKADALGPVVGFILSVATRRLIKPDRIRSFIACDEFATTYIPNFDQTPNTGRSYGVSAIIGVQDNVQLYEIYGHDQARKILASMANQFYGMINDPASAQEYAKIFGEENREESTTSVSQGKTTRSKRYFKEQLMPASKIMTQRKGEFCGKLVDSEEPYFKGKVMVKQQYDKLEYVKPFKHFDDLEATLTENFHKIKNDVLLIS